LQAQSSLPVRPAASDAPQKENKGQSMMSLRPVAKPPAPTKQKSTVSALPSIVPDIRQKPLRPLDNLSKNLLDRLDDRTPLQRGDEITYRVLEDRDQAVNLKVTDTGDVDFPLVGRVKVASKTCRQVAVEMGELLKEDYYYQATVLLELKALSKIDGKVYVYGQVANPGTIDFPTDEVLTVSKAIVKAGNIKEGGDRTKVTVFLKNDKDPDRQIVVNLERAVDEGRTDEDVVLKPEDSVMVPISPTFIKGRVYFYGQIGSPGVQEIPTGEVYTLSKAILRAGGFAGFADKRKVKIFRQAPDGKQVTIIVDMVDVFDKGRTDKDVKLMPGDYIQVPQRLVNF